MCGQTIPMMWDNCVQTRPNEEFLVFIDNSIGKATSFTYWEFDSRVNQTANMLSERFSISKGDRVALIMCNSVELIEWILATSKLGAVVVPMLPTLTSSEYDHLLSTSTPKLVAIQGLVFPELPEKHRQKVLWLEESTRLADDYSPEFDKEIHICSTDLAQIMFTSGTTACPKGVMLTHANFVFSGFYVNWQLAMTPRDRYLTSMMGTHVNFQLSALMPVITIGASLIFVSRYSARRFWKQVCSYGATLVQSMAMIARTMLAQPVDEEEKKHNVRFVHYFLPINDDEMREYKERFNVEIVNSYGLTETLVGVLTDIPYGPSKWPAVGIEGPGYEAQIRRDDGSVALPYEEGRIYIRGIQGKTLMAGYWRGKEDTKQTIDSYGWLATGDVGYRDDEGWFYFVERDARLIKRSGENISAREIELVLSQLDEVKDVAVIGIPDPIYDQVPKAIVVSTNSSLTERDVIEFAKKSLADFKVPAIVEFRNEIPRGLYGKLLIKQLRNDAK
ncbi:AMP-binding protein [Arcanobacterium buesumense]|nr:AMP-binding protein [Arcanobacterium buesumense]